MAVSTIKADIQIDGLGDVKKSLSGLKNEMDDVKKETGKVQKSLKKAGDSVKGFGSSVKEAGEKMLVLTGAIVAAAGASIAFSNEIENALVTMQRQLGASDKEMKSYEKSLKEVSKTGVGTFEEVGDAMSKVLQFNPKMNTHDLEKTTKQAMMLAKTMDADVGDVMKTQSILMKQFGLSGKEAFDWIAKGQQNGLNGSGDLLDIVSEFSVQFERSGGTADDFFGVLKSGVNEGVFDLSKIPDGLKNMMDSTMESSEEMTEIFKTLGINHNEYTKTMDKGGEKATEMRKKVVDSLMAIKDEQKRAELGATIFGGVWGDIGEKGVASLGSLNDEIKNVAGSMEDLEGSMTFEEEMLGMWNEVKIAMEPFGEALKELALEHLPPIIDAISELSEWFTNLSPESKEMVLGFIGVVAAIGPLLIALGSLIIFIGSVITGIGKIAGTLTFIGGIIVKVAGIIAAFFATTVGWAVLIIAGVAALAYLIIKYWDYVWAGIKFVLNAIWEAIKMHFTIIFKIIKFVLTAIWEAVKWHFTIIFNIIKFAVIAIWNIIKWVGQLIFNFFSWVGEKIIGAINWIVGKITGFVSKTSENFQKMKDSVREKVSSMVDGVKERFQNMRDRATEIFTNMWNKTKEIFGKIKDAITSPIDKAKELIGKAIDKIKDILDFDFKLPKLKLPKFSMKGKFSLTPPSVPKLGVDWFATGGIATGPSVVGIGEAGSEAILPLSNKSKMKPFADTVAGMISDYNKDKNNENKKGDTIITGNNFHLREEADIKRVAYELKRLDDKNKRPRGKRG